MKKISKKIVSSLGVFSLVTAIALSASAISFTDVHLDAWRTPKTVATQPLPYDSTWGKVNITMLSQQNPVADNTLAVGIYAYGNPCGPIVYFSGTGTQYIDYYYKYTKNTSLSCVAWFDAAAQYGNISGNVYF